MIDVHPLFFSPVYQITIPGGLPALDALKEYEYTCLSAEGSHNVFMTKNTSVLDDFPEEKKEILSHFYSIKNKYLRIEDTEFVMTTSWATRVEQGSISPYHRHPNNFYSGVFYFDECLEDTAPVEFSNPLYTHNPFQFNVTEYNNYNAQSHFFKFEKNTLVFFPSYLKHRIGHHPGPTPRYSAAFNFHPTGGYGFGDSEIKSSFFK